MVMDSYSNHSNTDHYSVPGYRPEARTEPPRSAYADRMYQPPHPNAPPSVAPAPGFSPGAPTVRNTVGTAPRSVKRSHPVKGVWFAGGSMLALAALLVVPSHKTSTDAAKPDLCQQVVQESSVLSRDELAKLIAVPERSSKESIRQIIQEPYCVLPSLTVREGAPAVREAYPLAFDPQTWFVVLYEGDEYAGFDFSFRRP